MLAPAGSVTINSGALLQGALSCNQLTINSSGTLKVVSAVVADSPSVSLTSPANNTEVSVPGSISLQASASDTTGTITSVIYYSGANAIGQSTSAPYQATWSNVPAGTYTLTAVATNSFGNSTTSAPVSVVVATAPSAPSVTGVTSGNGQATVAFSAPSSNGGQPITGYTVTSSPGGFTATGTSSPLTVAGLSDGTAYTFTVTAANAAGSSPASASSASVIPTGIASAPAIASVTTGNGQATVTITPPTTTGGLPLTYTVTSVPGGITATGTGTTFTLTGLTDGVSYTFAVTATNADGTSASSVPSVSSTPTGVATAPTISGVTPGDRQATKSPSNSAFKQRRPADHLFVYGHLESRWLHRDWNNEPDHGHGSDRRDSVHLCRFCDERGRHLACLNGLDISHADRHRASAPSIASVTTANGQATVTVAPPADSGGLPIEGYTVTSIPGGITATGPGPVFTLNGLTDGVAYSFAVAAINADGTSGASASSSPVTPTGIASAPSVASVTTADGQATVTVAPPRVRAACP